NAGLGKHRNRALGGLAPVPASDSAVTIVNPIMAHVDLREGAQLRGARLGEAKAARRHYGDKPERARLLGDAPEIPPRERLAAPESDRRDPGFARGLKAR